jgi:exodeoxyribonuclease VII large subunit
MTDAPDDITPLSVSVASRVARDKIAAWKSFWLEGEIAEWKPWQQIVFFTVKDETARIDCKIDGSSVTASGEQFTAGNKIRLFGQFDFWPKNGEMKFVANTIRHEGLGDFLVAIEKLRATLQAEGAFDESRKVPLPKFPRCIGLITAKDSDAEKDILVNARNRWADVQFRTVYTGVSGDAAISQIPGAIAQLDADPEVDVIIIARGGGAFLELVAFSDERIVRAAMACVTPLVSAIGHENDRPLLDEVADLRASTPTDAAKRVVPDVAADLAEIDQLRARGRQIVTTAITNQIDRIRQLASRPVMASPLAYLERHENDLANLAYRGSTFVDSFIHQTTDRLHGIVGKLRTLSPQKTLDRGYAIVRGVAGSVVTSTASVSTGDTLTLRVADGDIAATAN